MNFLSIGLNEALRLSLDAIKPLGTENITIVDSVGRIVSEDLYAIVDSPAAETSRKDGYAVISRDLKDVNSKNPIRLKIIGSMYAGDEKIIVMKPGTTVRLLTGARIPSDADAVIAEEYVVREADDILISSSIKEGRNILTRGSDVESGKCIIKSGRQISPIIAGLLAAAGYNIVPVFKNPIVGILGTGDEILEPGKPVEKGKLYASNIVTLAGWCARYKMKTYMSIVEDNHQVISAAIEEISENADAVITSGGAWTGDHDMVADVLEELGWEKIFHRIRMGPGKAVGFGILKKKPVFILPGGPPSNIMSFLQVALPGIHKLSGYKNPGLPAIKARLASDITECKTDWSDFFFGKVNCNDGLSIFHPMKKRSRLNLIADANALALVPEGLTAILKGSLIDVQLLI